MNEERYGTRYVGTFGIMPIILRNCLVCGALVEDMDLHDDFHDQLDRLADTTTEHTTEISSMGSKIVNLQGAAFNSGGRW